MGLLEEMMQRQKCLPYCEVGGERKTAPAVPLPEKEQEKESGLQDSRTPGLQEQQSLPAGQPPSSLNDILDHDAWYPVFFCYLAVCMEEDSQSCARFLTACNTTWSENVFKVDNMDGFKVLLQNVSEEFKAGLEDIVHDFPKYVLVKRRLQEVAQSRRHEIIGFESESNNDATAVMGAHESFMENFY